MESSLKYLSHLGLMMMAVGVCLANKLASGTFWLALLLSLVLKQKLLLPRLERHYKTAADHRDHKSKKGREKSDAVISLLRRTVAFSIVIVVSSIGFRIAMLSTYSEDWRRSVGLFQVPTTATVEQVPSKQLEEKYQPTSGISGYKYSFSCDGSALEVYIMVFCLIHLAHSGVLVYNISAQPRAKEDQLLPRTIKGRMIV
jgi:hypothetical protein